MKSAIYDRPEIVDVFWYLSVQILTAASHKKAQKSVIESGRNLVPIWKKPGNIKHWTNARKCVHGPPPCPSLRRHHRARPLSSSCTRESVQYDIWSEGCKFVSSFIQMSAPRSRRKAVGIGNERGWKSDMISKATGLWGSSAGDGNGASGVHVWNILPLLMAQRVINNTNRMHNPGKISISIYR